MLFRRVVNIKQAVLLHLQQVVHIGVVAPIRAVQRKVPLAAGKELKLVDRTGKTVRSPPPGKPDGIADCGKNLGRAGLDPGGSRVGAKFHWFHIRVHAGGGTAERWLMQAGSHGEIHP